MKHHRIGLTLAAVLLATTAVTAPSQAAAIQEGQAPAAGLPAPEIEIATEEFTLPNGLRVIVHTDRKAPVVAVNIWYHVGSRNEPPGRSGFAHLFEHLMFQGSENFQGEFFEPFGMVGVTDQNGTTHFDRTNYFQTVPTTALDMALWMESDRMGHLLGAIDQATLDEQRGVVLNEKRQRVGTPYAIFAELSYAGVFPPGHPYHLMPIGTTRDLESATLEDARNWFRSWYGPNNAVLVLAGDIDLATARERVTRYFGHIPASATVAAVNVPVPRMTAEVRETVQDRVTRTLVTRNFVAPGQHTEDGILLEMASIPLGIGAGSWLSNRLVRQDNVADGASAGYTGMELAGVFSLNAYVRDGESAERAEALLDEELARFLETGPSWEEVRAAQMLQTSSFARGLQRVSGKAELLNGCVSGTGRPDCWKAKMEVVAAATPERIRDAARRWLTGPSYRLTIEPGEAIAASVADARAQNIEPPQMTVAAADPRFTTLPPAVDRSLGVPSTDEFPELSLPPQQHATLSNGLQVVLVERHDTPLVSLRMDFLGGESVPDVNPAAVRAALSLADKGSGALNTQQFAARQMALGASIGAGLTGDAASLSLSAMSDQLPASLDLFADVVLNPAYAQDEIDLHRASTIISMRQQAMSPAILSTVLSEQIYGAGHPYNSRITEAEVEAVTRDDLVAYHRQWIRPELARITIAGDTTLAEIVPLLEAHFGNWKGQGPAVAVPASPVLPQPQQARIVLVNQPGAEQATIIAAMLVAPTNAPDADLLDASTRVLGGGFMSRLNLNLREDKQWSYGSGAAIGSSVGQRVWAANARVQADKTSESMTEMLNEIVALRDNSRPITEEEMERIRSSVFAFPSSFESISTFTSVIANGHLHGKPEDYLERYMELLGSVSAEQLQAAFSANINPDVLTWFVMGDLSQIEAPIRVLNLGETVVVDPTVPLTAASGEQ